MKKIYESEPNSWDERMETIIIYALEEGEYENLHEQYEDETGFNYQGMLNDMGYYCDSDYPYAIAPGEMYSNYYVERLTTHHLIISRWTSLNI